MLPVTGPRARALQIATWLAALALAAGAMSAAGTAWDTASEASGRVSIPSDQTEFDRMAPAAHHRPQRDHAPAVVLCQGDGHGHLQCRRTHDSVEDNGVDNVTDTVGTTAHDTEH